MTPGDNIRQRSTSLTLDERELLIINNALNEICNGVDIDDFEFPARIGADREEAQALLQRVGRLYDELARGAG